MIVAYQELAHYLRTLKTTFFTQLPDSGAYISISNSGRRGAVQTIALPLTKIIEFLDAIITHQSLFVPFTSYEESTWRTIARGDEPSLAAVGFGGFTGQLGQALGSHTKPTFTAIVKLVCWANDLEYSDNTPLPIQLSELNKAKISIEEVIKEYSPVLAITPPTTNVLPGRNVIYYGAPGTGKSYALRSCPNPIRCVFHADYLNSDFVGGYRPYQNDSVIEYRFVPGPFIEAFLIAVRKSEESVTLIIEELNRGNAGAIFGELFLLLDRDATGKSVYDINVSAELGQFLTKELGIKWTGKLYIPYNLSLLATMNSADQGVMPIDSAFKRRWEFEFMPIHFDPTELLSNSAYFTVGSIDYSWHQIAEVINEILKSLGFDEDRLIGQRFLSPAELADQRSFRRALSRKVFIYLWDDVLRHGHRNEIFNSEFRAYSDLQVAVDASRPDIFSEEIKSELVRRFNTPTSTSDSELSQVTEEYEVEDGTDE